MKTKIFIMNFGPINKRIDYNPSRSEWINNAEALSRQISANIIMILGEKYFPEFKWDTKRNRKLLYDLCLKIINQGGGNGFYNARWVAFICAFNRREIETRHWIEKEKENWNESEEGMSVEALDKFYWDYWSALVGVQSGIEKKDIKWVKYRIEK